MSLIKKIIAICSGNFFRHYDVALFGLLAPVLSPHLFPNSDPITALILTYAITPITFIARPVGTFIFGMIGDSYSRRDALFWSLLGMGVTSILFACIPMHGWGSALTPILFLGCRALQNFFAAGETLGGALLLLETCPKRHKDLCSGLYGASSMGGVLCASFGIYLLGMYLSSAWRLLYLLGAMTALIACLIRRQIQEPFRPVEKWPDWMSLGQILYQNRSVVCKIALVAGLAQVNYNMFFIGFNGLLPFITGCSVAEMMGMNTLLTLLDFCLLPVFGLFASKFSRGSMMFFSALGLALSLPLLFFSLEGAGWMHIFLVRVFLLLLGVGLAAPYYAWAEALIPNQHRAFILSVGSAIGASGIGAPVAAVSLFLFKVTGSPVISSLYWVFIALLNVGMYIPYFRSSKVRKFESISF